MREERQSSEEMNEEDDDVSELAGWLRNVFARLNNEQIQDASSPKNIVLVKKNLVHLIHHSHDKDEDVETYEYTQGVDSVEEMAREIVNRASQDSSKIGGASYFVRVEGVSSRWVISFAGPQTQNAAIVARGASAYQNQNGGGRQMGSGGGGYPMEPQNPAMMMFNAMVQDKTVQLAHNERLVDLVINSQADTNRMVKSVMAEQHETIRTYEKERLKGFGTMQELYDRKHERDLEFNTRLKNEERKDRAIGLMEPLAMSVAARFLGAKGVPAEMAPIVNMMSSAFNEMTPERLQGVVTSGLLKEKEVSALIEMFKVISSFEEEKLKKEHAQQQQQQQQQQQSQNGAATNGAAK